MRLIGVALSVLLVVVSSLSACGAVPEVERETSALICRTCGGWDDPPPCGEYGRACCSWGCSDGLFCDDNGTCAIEETVITCGTNGAACCMGVDVTACTDPGTACNWTTGTCAPCGGFGQPCCSNLSCGAGLNCWNSECGDRCGGLNGPPAC